MKKIALVYDWLDTRFGGAEKVLRNLHQLYPEAPLYVAYQTAAAPPWAKKLKIHTSFLQKHLWLCRFKPLIAYFLPFAFESFNFDEYDLVISVSSFAAKGILTKPHQKHYCYLLTPTRFLYSHQETYTDHWFLKIPPFKQIFRAIQKSLLRWDQVAAHRPDYLIPISQLVAARIHRYYHLDSLPPIYPPVDATRFDQLKKQLRARRPTTGILDQIPFSEFDLIVARHTAYKRVDLALKAAVQAKRPLVIVGTGPLTEYYHTLAAKLDPRHLYLHFTGATNDHDLVELYTAAQLFLMPGLEDFGITGLEAQLFGSPVLVHKSSGVAELIEHQVTGFHLEKETISALLEGYNWYEKHQTTISPSKIIKNSLKYDQEHFKQLFHRYVI